MASRRRMVRGLALAVGAAVALVGCGTTTDGSPTTSAAESSTTSKSSAPSSRNDAALWDPCGLPDSEVTAVGLDAATKSKTVAGVQFSGWKVCGWKAAAGWYDMTIFSGFPTLQDVRKRSDFEAFSARTVGKNQAVEFLDVGDTKRLGCTIAVETPQGSVAFRVLTRYSVGKQGEPCDEADRIANGLARFLPST